jgi:hypothetical protein
MASFHQVRRARVLADSCRATAVAVMLIMASHPALARDRTDVIVLTNGNRVTGEIKQLVQGRLQVKTSLMGTVQIDWVGVSTIESSQLFEVEDESGRKYVGTVAAGERGALSLITGPDGETRLEQDRIVRITQLEQRFRSRWSGHVDVGFNFVSASSATNLTVDAEATYRSKQVTSSQTLSSTYSDRDDADRTARSSFTSSYQRSLGGNSFWIGFAQLENNEELDLDLRTTLGGGVGRYLKRSSRSELTVLGALGGNREEYREQGAGSWNSELILRSGYDLFLFGGHETRISTSLSVLPSLSSWGRYRIELNASFRRELVHDLSLTLSMYGSYDSDPPSEDAVSNDWGTTTSLGWSF